MLREPAVDPVSFRRQACDVELRERSDHLSDREPRFPHELVRCRGQEVEDRTVGTCPLRRRLDPERFEDVARRSKGRRAESQKRVRPCRESRRDRSRRA